VSYLSTIILDSPHDELPRLSHKDTRPDGAGNLPTLRAGLVLSAFDEDTDQQAIGMTFLRPERSKLRHARSGVWIHAGLWGL